VFNLNLTCGFIYLGQIMAIFSTNHALCLSLVSSYISYQLVHNKQRVLCHLISAFYWLNTERKKMHGKNKIEFSSYVFPSSSFLYSFHLSLILPKFLFSSVSKATLGEQDYCKARSVSAC